MSKDQNTMSKYVGNIKGMFMVVFVRHPCRWMWMTVVLFPSLCVLIRKKWMSMTVPTHV